MLRSYLTLALRQLLRNGLYSTLNIGGLAIGLAVSTYIGLYVWHEFHYDQFHPFAQRTYRVLSVSKFDGQEVSWPHLHESFGREAKRQLPEVEQFVRLSQGDMPVWVQTDTDHRQKVNNIGFADPSFLTVMGFPLALGDAHTALTRPGQIVLTKPLAEKLFGSQNPLGKVITYDKKFSLTVSGVFNTLPSNTLLHINALVSITSLPALGSRNRDNWERSGFLETYLVLRPGADVKKIASTLKQVNSGLKVNLGKANFLLESLPSLHLYGKTAGEKTRQNLYIFLGIALLILVLAITNYVSLTTARAAQRTREVGVRKAIGGQRRELIKQFYTESLLVTTLAFMLGLGLLAMVFPWVNQQLGIYMGGHIAGERGYVMLIVVLWLTCSLLAGSYPALLLSGFRPQDTLKSTATAGRRGVGMRRVLTTGQFVASVGLLICSLIFYAQMRFMRTKNIGLDRSQVVAVTVDPEMVSQYTSFRDAVRQWAGAGRVAATNTRLFTPFIMTYFVTGSRVKKQVMLNALTVDKSFFSTLGINWLLPPVGWKEKPITKELHVFNQWAVKEAGETVKVVPHPDPFGFAKDGIEGITADFNLFGLQQQQSPVMLNVVSDTSRAVVADGGYLLVKLSPGQDVPVALGQLKLLYEQASQSGASPAPFDYYFLDDAYNKLYEKEQQLATLVNGFTVLTLLVACLGLLGLMTFTVEARTKEIGIRKVLGASVAGIVSLLSRELILLVVLSVLIASPLAYWAMTKWLANFAYKITIPWWAFAGAGAGALLIALLTVSVQSIRAAVGNPVKALRSE
ncbi:ABC transporter permease [Fibrella sp. HMF5335]|uniref:ABC transporter permease n=1 Tax=Fibrella rubiginis TaxID=2817060 RepID=A0A939GE89_9BACT|nr:FtsX-like permease family protein [Fibrella rubiginis]MBO0937497.1 ABC transporter permease [Fibrella rubiginis]